MEVSNQTQEVGPPPSRERDAVPAFQRFMERIGNFWTLGVLLLLIVIFGIAAPSLFTKAAWLSTSSYAVEYLILAVGQTFVIITAGIDLSDGAILGFAGMAGALADGAPRHQSGLGRPDRHPRDRRDARRRAPDRGHQRLADHEAQASARSS